MTHIKIIVCKTTKNEVFIIFSNKDAPILICMGQSNSHGHATHLPEDEKICTPLKNVFGLSADIHRAYDLSDVKWEGFVTHGMNLGETQDHTYCLAEGFARKWEAASKQLNLPSLYIVQISIGAQGIAKEEKSGNNMWYPHRTPKIEIGGNYGYDISLYPLATQIMSLVINNLTQTGKTPKIVALHWNQWETEVDTGGQSIIDAQKNYSELFGGFTKALGLEYPLWLYKPACPYLDKNDMMTITQVFESLQKNSEEVHIIDLKSSPNYNEKSETLGIFLEDKIHYTPEIHRWFAQLAFEDAVK